MGRILKNLLGELAAELLAAIASAVIIMAILFVGAILFVKFYATGNDDRVRDAVERARAAESQNP